MTYSQQLNQGRLGAVCGRLGDKTFVQHTLDV